eukprot:GHVT01078852.1.p1 GENE.GHVT01078852.1~~GHVT01078852.1.p1  ORF type:complete len:314 (-),score=41.27 GHVT01078852.1:442-1383(-)
MSRRNPRVYMDVAIGTKAGGRIVFELFSDVTPKTAENFRALCTGERATSRTTGTRLHYLGCKFFRVVPGFMAQAGDIQSNNGDGGESIYGKSFQDESFTRRHAQAGVLSMANVGRNTNGSQFFITLRKCPQLDGKHVAFGQLVEGMEILRAIEKIPTANKHAPRVPIVIAGCGELDAQSNLARLVRPRDAVGQQRQLVERLMGTGAATSASGASAAGKLGEGAPGSDSGSSSDEDANAPQTRTLRRKQMKELKKQKILNSAATAGHQILLNAAEGKTETCDNILKKSKIIITAKQVVAEANYFLQLENVYANF